MTQQQWDQNSEDDVQVPMGVGGEAAPESYEPESKPKVNGPTLILFGAFATALVVIYLIGMQNKPRAASAEALARQEQVQSAITELLQKNGKAEQLKGIFKDTDRLVKMFYSYLGGDTTENAELAHDPFVVDEVPASTPASEASQIVNTSSVDSEKLRRVAETFASLKLQSVMVGKTSIAMINNHMVTVGAKLGDLTVTAIEPTRVLLSFGQSKFELKSDNESAEKQ